MESRESIVFYRSFYEAIKDLPAEEFKKCACAMLGYGLDGEEPEVDGVAKSVFVMAKPQIDKNSQRYANGKNGGRKTKPEPNQNQTGTKTGKPETKPEPNHKKAEPNVNDNVNVNENIPPLTPQTGGNAPKRTKQAAENQPEKVPFAEFVTMTNDEYLSLIEKYGESDTKRLIEILDNYKGSSGKKYKSDYRAILAWVYAKLEEEKAKKPQGFLESPDHDDLERIARRRVMESG